MSLGTGKAEGELSAALSTWELVLWGSLCLSCAASGRRMLRGGPRWFFYSKLQVVKSLNVAGKGKKVLFLHLSIARKSLSVLICLRYYFKKTGINTPSSASVV